MTDADILTEMRRQHGDWLKRRSLGRSKIGLLLLTTLVTVFNLARPQFISPFQHMLTGFIVARTSPRDIMKQMDVRSLWALHSLVFIKATIDRCRPFDDHDFEFVSNIHASLDGLDVDERSTYGPHLAMCMDMLPRINPEARRMLACHVELLGHAAPPASLRSRLRLRRRSA